MNLKMRNFTQIKLFHYQKHDHQLKHYQSHKSKPHIRRKYFFDDRENRNHHREKQRKKQVIFNKNSFKTYVQNLPDREVDKKY